MSVAVETWPIAGAFTIARGSRTEARVVVATLSSGSSAGRGECVPYQRYGETVEGVAATIQAMEDKLRNGLTRTELQAAMPAGAARNAIDCALWDLEAKLGGRRAWMAAALSGPKPVTTAFTISVGSPETMEAKSREARSRPLLKIKLGGEGDIDRIAAVRRGAPDSILIADANEAWTAAMLRDNLKACFDADVKLIEQPLPASGDTVLGELTTADRFGIPICADESLHTASDLDDVAKRYQAVNIKLDKTGGLTAALQLKAKAQALSLQIMIGCMLGTSLAMAPALLLTDAADYVDLDGPLLLARDREPGLKFNGSQIEPPPPDLWG